MSNAPLMPKATAVWLVDNTALSFDQVADVVTRKEVREILGGHIRVDRHFDKRPTLPR